MRQLVTIAAIALTSVACGSPDVLAARDGSPETVRISVDQLLDPTFAIPDNVGGIDLEELTVDPDTDFCDASALAPGRWVNDAIVPVQYWLDLFSTARGSAPDALQADLDLLIEHASDLMRWNFKHEPDRPEWSAAKANAAANVYETAALTCPDLPLAIGIEPDPDGLSSWPDINEACARQRSYVQEGIDWFSEQYGEFPIHQEQIEHRNDAFRYENLDEDGYPTLDDLFIPSDFMGVGPNGSVVPISGSACDL